MTRIRLFTILCLLSTACAGDSQLFPDVPTSTSEAEAALPNPISIIVDEANSQIVVANSNVDVSYNTGSLSLFTFSATDTNAPELSLTSVVLAPNYAGQMYYDGVASIYVPFRAEFGAGDVTADEDADDTLNKYTLLAGSLTETLSVAIDPNPYGVASLADQIYVVSDDVLNIFDTSLALQTSIDLTTADSADLEDALSEDVLAVALDATLNLAVVTNAGGKPFVVDLASATLTKAIDGPTSTNEVIINNGLVYILDAVTEAVWIFNLANLSDPTSGVEDVDDSEFLIATVAVGNTPSSMLLDTTGNRLYVSNSGDATISVIDTVAFVEQGRVLLDDEDISSDFLRDCEDPMGMAMGTFNTIKFLFVSCFSSHDVAVINTSTLKVVELFPNTIDENENDDDEE